MNLQTHNMFIFLYMVFIACTFHLKTSCENEIDGSADEVAALLSWKASLESENRSLSSWNYTNTTKSCNWEGIGCDRSGKIVQINLTHHSIRGTLDRLNFSCFEYLLSLTLSYNSLHGMIPSTINTLLRLSYLDLSVNDFSGIIPPGFSINLKFLDMNTNKINGIIPENFFVNLTSLEYLNLGSNVLTGSIPPEIGMLTSLLTFNLSKNNFTGSIPVEVFELSSLVVFELSENNFTGEIPSSVGNLTSLTFFSLYDNVISGSIPQEIGKLKGLKHLDLRNNILTGSIPDSIGNLTELNNLLLGLNNLSGHIPSSIGDLTLLLALHLVQNQLSGTIPSDFNNFTYLTEFRFGDNYFTGSIPENICVGGVLARLTGNDNRLTGMLLKSLRNCSSLYRVRFDMNQFTENISENLGIFPDLDFVDLSYNNFYGELSPKWGRYVKMTSLSISNNNLTGKLPPELGKATDLQRIDLSRNQLSSDIPESLWNLTLLYQLNLDGNRFSGSVSSEIGKLTMLSHLNLGENNLTGIIPGEVGDCVKLVYLNLSENGFTGAIPSEIAKLNSLESLDFSRNKLISIIPQELGKLLSIENLDLSHNNLSGSIPSTFGHSFSLISINISYNCLEGRLPNIPAFQNALFDSLSYNKGLCGNVSGLKPCTTLSKHESQTDLILISVLVFASLFLLFMVIGCFLILRSPSASAKVDPIKPRDTTTFTIWSFDGKIAYENIIEATENFNIRFCIGVGAYGRVYKAELPTGQTVAVKHIHESEDHVLQMLKSFENEITTLTELRHRNIVKLYGFCSHVHHSFLVYEFLEGGSLLERLTSDELAAEFGWMNRVKVINGIINALSYMHHDCSPPLVHRDISSKNVLLDGNYEAHLSDFGTARLLNHDSSDWTSFAGTYGYAAPELAYTMEISAKNDIYSFGVLTLEVIIGRHPGDFISQMSLTPTTRLVLLKDVIDQRLSPPTMEEAEEIIFAAKLAFSCLHPKPQFRPTMRQVSVHVEKQRASTGNLFSTVTIGELINENVLVCEHNNILHF